MNTTVILSEVEGSRRSHLEAFAAGSSTALGMTEVIKSISHTSFPSKSALRAATLAQFAIAILNLFLIRIMKWKPDLERTPLIIREIFRMHVVFISIMLSIFAALSWRFAYEIARASGQPTIWLAVAIGSFWPFRSAMQWLHYSPSDWRGDALRTVIHRALFLGYGAMVTVYLAAAFWRNA